MTERIKAGPARSERELSIYTTTQAVCPKCKHQGLIPYGVQKSPTAPVAQTNCPICNALVDVEFSAGPGWGNEPDDLLHFALGEAPSSLLPESYFRAGVERRARKVRRDPSDHDIVLSAAGSGIGDLLEIRKLNLAAGRELSAADRALLAELATALTDAGGSITEDVAELIQTGGKR